jgi:hypothetical protein
MIARVAFTLFLLVVLVVLAYEAIKVDGIAAPILGR